MQPIQVTYTFTNARAFFGPGANACRRRSGQDHRLAAAPPPVQRVGDGNLDRFRDEHLDPDCARDPHRRAAQLVVCQLDR
jgi:hypothetical protein